MNHYKALQREKDKRWDMTVNGHQATGYCRAYKPIPEDAKWLPAEHIKRHNEQEARFTHKYHTDGHATEAEAYACYREYLLDHQLKLNRTNAGTQHRCQVCGAWTQKFAEVSFEIFHLCDEHNNREMVANLLGSLGEIWSSY